MAEPWSQNKNQVIQGAGTDAGKGLTQAEAAERLKQEGANKLTEPVKVTFWGTFWEEVREPMILLLLVVGVLYSFFGELRDAATIFIVIFLLVMTEVYTEYRAHGAISALRKLSPTTTPVIRDGKFWRIPSENVVRGDVIPLEAGDLVPADARVIESYGLQSNESALTGESAPVTKEDAEIPESAPVTDRSDMVFAGTAITGGTGKAVVTATGMKTEIGKIHGLVQEARQPRTPLQSAMRELSGLLAWVAIFFSAVIPLVGILQGKPWQDMLLTGLSLAFAVIPEELPIIITMVLALGGLALAKRHVLIRNLRSAETLGSVTVIVTDKTGTITENKMAVSEIATDATTSRLPTKALSLADVRLLKVGVLTSRVKQAQNGDFTGDPLEVALLNAARDDGISPEVFQSQYRKFEEFAFDNQRKMMSVVYYEVNGLVVYAKGAPEVILSRCQRIAQKNGEKEKTPDDEARILKQAEEMAAEAMRIIAFAYKNVTNETPLSRDEAENGLVFLGLAGMTDPPRPGVAEAIAATKEAGIRTIMVTGDLPLTAQKIADEVGIGDGSRTVTGVQMAGMKEDEVKQTVEKTDVFARINPGQKLDIVKALQSENEIVSVTGDGINDAPALKAADIGIAMGEKGTEAAREAASMVLTNDSYSSIVDGVREGRRIFDNLRKGVMYYLGVKVALVLCFLIPLALALPFPFAPIQIVLLELFMDLAASATFVAEPMEADVMHRPPRDPKRRFIDQPFLTEMILAALSLAVAVLFNYLYAYYGGTDATEARTLAFGTWLIGHIFLAFTMRSQRETLFKIGLLTNPIMIVWAAAAIAFFLLIIFIPELHPLLRVSYLSGKSWIMVFAVPFVAIFWHEVAKLFRGRK